MHQQHWRIQTVQLLETPQKWEVLRSTKETLSFVDWLDSIKAKYFELNL